MEDLGLGRRLQIARLALGMGQGEAARKIGTSRDTLSRWENAEKSGAPGSDDRYPNASSLRKLCELYNVSSDWLLFGDTRRLLHALTPVSDHLTVVETTSARRPSSPHQPPLLSPVRPYST